MNGRPMSLLTNIAKGRTFQSVSLFFYKDYKYV